ncbi:MAG: N-6 DNA methylase, partial [Phycisphaerales bacterium]|nr:N-6 DNA methylase [Phycisphaerales bacterium]
MGKRRVPNPQQPDLFETHAAEVERFAEQFADALREAATGARREEDIRVAVERQLAVLGQQINVRIEGQHEYTLLRGAVDSVYGSVFIEYKNPADPGSRLGPSLTSPGTRKVAQQIDQRFAAVATQIGRTGATMLGIGCDGRYFLFRRFVSGHIVEEDPVEVSRWSARRFLFALFNLGTRGLALTPEFLADDFGSESQRARDGVLAFLDALRATRDDPRVRTFFGQWTILFGEVCGYDLTNPRGRLQLLAETYGSADDDPVSILFALHTYYALFMKLLAAHVVSYFQRVGVSSISDINGAPTSEAARDRLRRLEDGDVYRELGVTNFLEGDLFSWYLSAWSDAIEACIRGVAARLLEYNPNSLRDNPTQARDLLKKLYQQLVPKQVRHDLGEYYTPDWLAEQTLDAAGYDGEPSVRLLDPACGSGTFLVLALARVRRWVERNFESAGTPQEVARAAAANVIGFDLNPLAVLAARTNYVIQFYDLFDYRGTLEVPVYLCDSVLTPAEYGRRDEQELWEKPVAVPTSAKLFLVPREVTHDRETLGKYCNILAEYTRAPSGFTAADFLDRCRQNGIFITDAVRDQHIQLFEDIRSLDRDRRNGVWARFIKNAFAPVFLQSDPVDLVVGNPPWVNWESLPGRMEADIEEGKRPNYRQQIAEVFKSYGLFSLSGTAGRLGGGKKDLSMLFVYACADRFLREGGTLAFVITQTIFKTKGAGDGFRRFEFEVPSRDTVNTIHLGVKGVHDLTDFQPFEGATNR